MASALDPSSRITLRAAVSVFCSGKWDVSIVDALSHVRKTYPLMGRVVERADISRELQAIRFRRDLAGGKDAWKHEMRDHQLWGRAAADDRGYTMGRVGMTPGTYLRLRREAAALSIEDVAARITSEPRLGELDRAEWLRQIERDEAPASGLVAVALAPVFNFSPGILGCLAAVADGHGNPNAVPNICARCGCSEADACFDGHATCAWATADLCTHCERKGHAHAA